MCTSFVFRKNQVFVGMNFDNDGREYRVSDIGGKGFLISVKAGNSFFPSIGINPNGIFVNDQMVDAHEKGIYRRQNNKRWVTSTLIDTILKTNINFPEIVAILERVEIVNAPMSSTHVLIVDQSGDLCVVEPGKKNILSKREASNWFILTNFPMSDYNEIPPNHVTGSGSERYMKGLCLLSDKDEMTVELGLSILKDLRQNNSTWTTELSLIYDVTHRELYYCQRRNFEDIQTIRLELNA